MKPYQNCGGSVDSTSTAKFNCIVARIDSTALQSHLIFPPFNLSYCNHELREYRACECARRRNRPAPKHTVAALSAVRYGDIAPLEINAVGALFPGLVGRLHGFEKSVEAL
jgi:hypothetical protein